MKLLVTSFLLVSMNVFAQSLESVTYRVTITSDWNEVDHLSVPRSAHFSPIVAVAHNKNYNLLPLGEVAGPGLELVAEMGRTSVIEGEIEEAKKNGAVSNLVITKNQFISNQLIQTFEIVIDKNHPFLSFVSMIAPSPDWVIGMPSLRLYNPSTGFSEGVGPRALYAIDAGTESGDFGGNFSIRNKETNPKSAVSHISGPGFREKFATLEVEVVK